MCRWVDWSPLSQGLWVGPVQIRSFEFLGAQEILYRRTRSFFLTRLTPRLL